MSMTQRKTPFFVHYLPLPPELRAFVVWLVFGLSVLTLILSIAVPALQDQFGPGWRQPTREISGLLLDGPGAPQLLIPRPEGAGDSAYSRILLASTRKLAPPAAVLDKAGQWVTLRGALFSNGSLTLMNSNRATVLDAPLSTQPVPTDPTALGTFTLKGEIIDGKCFSGVMKPGAGKTHLGCAVRCISGGVPALFHTRNARGQELDLLLVDEKGDAVNDRVLDRVALPLEISGEVLQLNDLLLLRADPSQYRLLL